MRYIPGGSQGLTLMQKESSGRREERQWFLWQAASASERHSSSLLFETLAGPTVTYLRQDTHKYHEDAELGMGVGREAQEKTLWAPLCVVPWAQITVLHAVQTPAQSYKIHYYILRWVLAKDDIQLLFCFKHFFSRKCVYASKQQPLPRKTVKAPNRKRSIP